MADTRITAISTTYDRDTISLSTDYLIGDRSGGSSFRAQADEIVLGVLENIAENVGIGTATPGALLEVESAASTTGVIINNTATDGDPYLSFALSGTNAFTIGVDDSDSDKFKIGTTAIGTNTRLAIDSSGNVGIGTATPGALLHLYGAEPILRFEDTGAGGSYAEISANSSYGAVLIKADDSNASGAGYIDLRTGGSTRMRVDASGNVGIGTTSPQVKTHISSGSHGTFQSTFGVALAVESSTQARLGIFTPNTAAGILSFGDPQDHDIGMLIYDHSNDSMQMYVNAAERMRIDSSGNVGIGTTSPNDKLTVSGNITPATDNSTDIGAASYRWDDVYATNGTIQTSDRRMKSDIADSDLGLEFIRSLRPVSFKRDSGKRTHYGLIAQEVEAALAGRDFAGLIYDKDSDRYGMRYDELIAPLIAAVQQLTQRVESLEQGA